MPIGEDGIDASRVPTASVSVLEPPPRAAPRLQEPLRLKTMRQGRAVEAIFVKFYILIENK